MSQKETSQGVCFRKEEREPSWEADLLGRKDAAHQLERLIANAPGPYVIAMTSEWGSGKTFFLKAWEKDLRDRHRPCVYFNAWETDHAGDPLLALTGCITDSLKEHDFIEPNRLKELAESASKIVAQSPGTIAKLAVGVANHFSSGALKEVKEILEDSVKLGTDLFLKNKRRRTDFANQLKKIAAEASTSATKQDWNDPVNGTKKFPLFVMIDELDRCRPSYVIELLENIKHLFGVPGVVFLLAIDQNQIHGVIQHTFGLCDANRQNYLRKFIDVFWKLPNPDAFTYVFNILKTKKVPVPSDWTCQPTAYWDPLIAKSNSTFFDGENLFYATLAMSFKGNTNMSLREATQLIDKFNILSLAYPLSTKDAFIILRILSTPSERHNDIKNSLRTTRDTLEKRGYPQEGSDIQLDDISAYINNYIFNYIAPNFMYPPQKNQREQLLYEFFKNLIKPFLGIDLYDTAMHRIDFLDEFDFGDAPKTDKSEMEMNTQVAMPARPHQDQADH